MRGNYVIVGLLLSPIPRVSVCALGLRLRSLGCFVIFFENVGGCCVVMIEAVILN